MTKRALIVIAVLLIIPVVIVCRNYKEWKASNQTVAEYGDSVDEIIYGKEKLRKVEGSDDYLFRQGKYLGKVGSSYFGSQLYTLKDDESGDYYVMAGNDGLVLLNESGKMTDGIKGARSTVTRVIIDNYRGYTDSEEEIMLFSDESGFEKSFQFTPADYKEGKYREFEIRYCYDGSAVATGYGGKYIYLTEKNKWIYISEKSIEAAEYDYKQGVTKNITYNGKQLESPALMRVLGRIALGQSAETSSSASETTAKPTN